MDVSTAPNYPMADVADAATKDCAMIALLPMTDDWCKIDCPHMTLVYCGLLKDLNPSEFNEMAKDAASIAMMTRPITLTVMGVELFGENNDTHVLKLRPTPELWAMRRSVDHWNASEFPFNPHATIGPAGIIPSNVPSMLAFDRIMVGWGDEYLTFWFKKGM